MRMTPLAVALLTATLAAVTVPGASTAAAATPTAAKATADATVDARFADLSKRWLDGFLKPNPVGATQQGDHRFDAEIEDVADLLVDDRFGQAKARHLGAHESAALPVGFENGDFVAERGQVAGDGQ